MNWKLKYMEPAEGRKVKALTGLPPHYKKGDILTLISFHGDGYNGEKMWIVDGRCNKEVGIYEHEFKVVG